MRYFYGKSNNTKLSNDVGQCTSHRPVNCIRYHQRQPVSYSSVKLVPSVRQTVLYTGSPMTTGRVSINMECGSLKTWVFCFV